jgi:PIN domain nuclease of toxin-antitoxin system
VIVLDTHVWIWWVNGSSVLSTAAKRAIEQAKNENTMYLSSISAWEVALLVEKSRLRLSMNAEEWIAKSESLPYLHFVSVDNRIALQSVQLPGAFHSDPADRIIVATALTLGADLVTKDDKIRSYPHVKTVW